MAQFHLMRKGVVTSRVITDGTIATDDLAGDCVTNAKIADAQIDSEHYVTGSIDAGHISTGAVTTAKLAAGVISADATGRALFATGVLDEATVDAAVAAGAIDSDRIKSSSLTATQMATGAVTPVKIEGLAHTADTVRIRTPQLMTINFAAGTAWDANDDMVFTFAAGHDVLVLDMFVNQTTAEGGALTATLRTAANGGGTAISAAVDLNSAAGTVLRPTTFAPTAVSAGGAVYLKASANPATTAGAASLLFVYTT